MKSHLSGKIYLWIMQNLYWVLSMNERELWLLKEDIEREAKRAEEDGFVHLDIGNSLKQAEELLDKYRATKGWEGGYGGRAKFYELGFDLDRETLLLKAKEFLFRAKGAVLALRLPRWAKEHRYFYVDKVFGQDLNLEGLKAFDPRRGVVFFSGRTWAMKGFPETQEGLWYRCNCRPTVEGVKLIEKLHEEGKRVGTYMSGGMMAITFALLPDSEDDWTDEFLREYAGHYWRGEKQRYWGARGSSSEWNSNIVPRMDFCRWMAAQLEFARRIGFDFIHLDEAWGRYLETRELCERNPNFVICPNNLARMYVWEDTWRYGWTSMGESLGHPSKWDEFYQRMRRRSWKAYNIPWWGWHTYRPFEEKYQNLTFATTLANKGTDVSHSNPTDEYIEFSRRFSDYIYGPYVDVYVSQERVKTINPPKSLRTILNRRVLGKGGEELILHLLNIDPDVPSLKNIKLEIDTSGFNIKWPPTVTFSTPELGIKELNVDFEGREVLIEVPEIKTWGLIVIGYRLFPRVDISLKSRGCATVTNPLDNGFVPGEEIKVEVKVEEIVPIDYSLHLHLPEGWKILKTEKTSSEENVETYMFTILPLFARLDRGYAITPVVKCEDEEAPTWPLLLQAKDKIGFRLVPPMAESPEIELDYELEVRNFTKSGFLEFTLRLPEGWTADKKDFKMRLKAGETKRIPIKMKPKDYHIRFWEWVDVNIPINWTFQGLQGSSLLRVRVFPAPFYVYAEGVEKLIMHSYPNLYFLKSLEEARTAIREGKFVALWLVNRDPERYRDIVDEIISLGGGVLWMGEPFNSDNCPVILEERNLKSTSIRYITLQGNMQKILAPALRIRSFYRSDKGFKVYKVKAKDWGAVSAVWGPPPQGQSDKIEGTPAVIVSKDKERKIVYIGSDLEVTSEEHYRFEDRRHYDSYWYQTYIFYNFLNWLSGAYTL